MIGWLTSTQSHRKRYNSFDDKAIVRLKPTIHHDSFLCDAFDYFVFIDSLYSEMFLDPALADNTPYKSLPDVDLAIVR